jgi:hypothetical protein
MKKVYKSAQGRMVDMEKLRLANEETIAVGNMRVNARGDQLGPGGRVVKTRNQVMKEYYNINNTGIADAASRPAPRRPQKGTFSLDEDPAPAPAPATNAAPAPAPATESSAELDAEALMWDEEAEGESGTRTRRSRRS